MTLSRRRFLKAGALSAFAAGCALAPGLRALGQDLTQTSPAVDFPLPFEATQNPLFYYTRQTFEPYVGTAFRGRGVGGRVVSLQLLGVRAYQPDPATRITTGRARPTESFTLSFRASRPLSEQTTTHGLVHDALSEVSLFLTQYTDKRGRAFYEAVVNHIAL